MLTATSNIIYVSWIISDIKDIITINTGNLRIVKWQYAEVCSELHQFRISEMDNVSENVILGSCIFLYRPLLLPSPIQDCADSLQKYKQQENPIRRNTQLHNLSVVLFSYFFWGFGIF